ncbi:MAG: hypothetical protein JWM11_1594 [Planctomycetaceae bacterium]|nr:hypothetical protein [Planctomycetaceae bacterium]
MSLRRLSLVVCFAVTFSALHAADQLAEKWQKRIDTVQSTYAAAVAKADNARFFAVQKANGDRLAALKKAMSEATKAGDFDTATALKELVATAERDGAIRPKPKNIVKFGGHEYAVIQEPATWHIAKKRCEEMGGHLVVCETPEESAFILELSAGENVWGGATEEENEGDWRWIIGNAKFTLPNKFNGDGGRSRALMTYQKEWDDNPPSVRNKYFCEWDK